MLSAVLQSIQNQFRFRPRQEFGTLLERARKIAAQHFANLGFRHGGMPFPSISGNSKSHPHGLSVDTGLRGFPERNTQHLTVIVVGEEKSTRHERLLLDRKDHWSKVDPLSNSQRITTSLLKGFTMNTTGV